MEPLLHARREVLDILSVNHIGRKPHTREQLLVLHGGKRRRAAEAQKEVEVLPRRELRVSVELRRDNADSRPVRCLAERLPAIFGHDLSLIRQQQFRG